MAHLFGLHSKEASIVLELDPQHRVLWRHCGARVDPADMPALAEARGPASFAMDGDVSLALFPPAGLGWFGPAVVEARNIAGEAFVFAPDRCDIADTSGQLAITARDSIAGIELHLTIDLVEGGAFRFASRITNTGTAALLIDAAASLQVPLPATAERIISWRGRHNAELSECREAMPQHGWQRISRRGISGHGGPPGVYVLDRNAGWHTGLAYAMQLAWSGDSVIGIEHEDEGYWTLGAKATPAPGEIVLAPGDTRETPPAILAISTRGRCGAMQQQHAAVRAMLRWPGGAMRPRPVHLNSWEACYFDHDAARIERLARAAALVGIERFVLDDGWFKGRRDDTSGLGDWEPDPVTYPDGLAPLARAVEALGMEFGLWVEPEMISPDSDLYRAHPDWALALPGRAQPTARHQLVIDMRLRQVRDHLFQRLDAVLRNTPIGYLKWDHNRDLMVERAGTVYADTEAAKYVWGTGFHWYGEDHFDHVQLVHDAWPDKQLLFTEGCQEGGPHHGSWALAERYARSIIQDLNHWTVGWIDWNLLLDEQGGPNHVGNFCSAPILVDTDQNRFECQSSYHYIGHFARFVRPGARRILCAASREALEATAFVNTDGGVVVVAMNRTGQPLPFALQVGGIRHEAALAPRSIATLLLP